MIEIPMTRREAMEMAFKELDKIVNPLIVEVGRLRSVFGQETDGFSTLHFAAYLSRRQAGKLVSVDNDPATEAMSRNILEKQGVVIGDRIGFVNDDALEHFKTMNQESNIDLLYLDAWDCIGLSSEPSAINHLECFELANPFVEAGGLLMVDDVFNPETPSGKGKYAIPRAIELGYEILSRGYAWLLRKGKAI